VTELAQKDLACVAAAVLNVGTRKTGGRTPAITTLLCLFLRSLADAKFPLADTSVHLNQKQFVKA